MRARLINTTEIHRKLFEGFPEQEPYRFILDHEDMQMHHFLHILFLSTVDPYP